MANGEDLEEFGGTLFWDNILELIAEGRVIPIIGRELLTVKDHDSEFQLYPYLAKLAANKLEVSGEELPEGDELNTVAIRCLEKKKKIDFVYLALNKVMPSEEEFSTPRSLRLLSKIPFKLFVTTTFDPLLERAVNQVRFNGEAKTDVFAYSPESCQDLPEPLEKLKNPAIFHLFGKLSPRPFYAVTQEDILEFLLSLHSENRQPKNLFDALSRSNLLILGCSFGDWLARFFIRTAKRKRLSEARDSINYVVDRKISGDSNLVIFLRHFSSYTEIYPYGDASEFIERLYDRWQKVKPVPPSTSCSKSTAISEIEKRGAVFLSYASEDREAAKKIRDALENAGVSVFFDKLDIHGGEDWETKLKNCIKEASLFLALISKNALIPMRRKLRSEWRWAIEEDNNALVTETFIIPIAIDETPLTHAALPPAFSQRQGVQLMDGRTDADFVDHIKKLYRKYQQILMEGW